MTTRRLNSVSSIGFERIAELGTFVVTSVLIAYLTLVQSASIHERADTYRLRRFFTAQAEAMLGGRLWVARPDGAHECFFDDGNCYGYFGLFPSVIRLPFLWLANGDGMTDIFMMIGLVIGVAGSIVIVRTVMSAIVRDTQTLSSRLSYLAALIIAAPGNLWIQITLPTGYEEAIVWASTCATWGLVAFVLWWRTAQTRWLGWATIAFIAGASSRPSVIPISISAATIIAIAIATSSKRLRSRGVMGWTVAMATLPIGSAVSVWYAKLGHFLPPLAVNEWVMQSDRWARIMTINGGHDSWWGFIPTNLVQYLRPDSVMFDHGVLKSVRPDVEGVLYLPPLDGPGIFVGPMASVTALVPAVVVLVIVALWRTPRLVSVIAESGRLPRIASVGIALVGWSALALLAINVGVQNRYMGDLAPAIALTAAFGAASIGNWSAKRPWVRTALVGILCVLAVSGVAIQVLHQSWQIARYL